MSNLPGPVLKFRYFWGKMSLRLMLVIGELLVFFSVIWKLIVCPGVYLGSVISRLLTNVPVCGF